MRQRIRDIDIARGLGIFLIIVHHVAQYMMGYDVTHFDKSLWESIVYGLGMVNIPTFIFLSGMIFGLNGKHIYSFHDYKSFEYRKLCRFMLPFLSISFIQMAIKIVAPGRGIAEAPYALWHMLFAPRGGAAGHLWFLCCLMGIFLIWPVLMWLSRKIGFVIMLIGILVLAILPIPWPVDNCSTPHPILSLNDIIWYLPIFGFGFYFGSRIITKQYLKTYHLVISLVIFIVAMCSIYLINWPEKIIWDAVYRFVKFTIAISGATSIYLVSKIIDRSTGGIGKSIQKTGLYSYDIYLLHVAFAGHPFAFLIGKLHINIITTYILFVGVLIAAVIIPLLISRVIRKFPFVSFIILGIPINFQKIPDRIFENSKG